MRVLLTTYTEKTHFMLMAPLAWALRTAGHEVRVAVQPAFAAEVTRAGLTAVPVGADRNLYQVLGRVPNWLGRDKGWPPPYDSALRPESEVDLNELVEGYRHQVGRWHKTSNVPIITDLVAFAQQWRPDLVLWEPTTYAGAIAAASCDAAHGRVLIGMDAFALTRAHYRRLVAGRPADERPDPLGEWLAGYARRYGTASGEDLVVGQFTIDQLPASLCVRADLSYLSMRYVPYGGAAVVPGWLHPPPTRPRVALTMGLTVDRHDDAFPLGLQDLLDNLADLDIELIATVSDVQRDKLERIPDNARLVPYVPLQALMPSCAAIIHHGGVGTMLTAAAHAVPQLVLPFDADQPELAQRLAACGAGLAVPAATATGARVRESLLRLLGDPEARAAAQALRAEVMDQPTPHELVSRLEELARR